MKDSHKVLCDRKAFSLAKRPLLRGEVNWYKQYQQLTAQQFIP